MAGRLQNCIEDVNIVLVEEVMLAETEQCLRGCETCAVNATIALDHVLDVLTDSDAARTEYLMLRPARCPSCGGDIREKTLVLV